MKEKILLAVLIASLFFESSLTSLPLLVGALILCAVLTRKSWVFLAAFLAGVIFDALTLRTVGTTATFFLVLIFLIFLYENKFETETLPFVFISTFFSSFAFLIFLGFGSLLLQALVVALITSLLFQLLYKQQ